MWLPATAPPIGYFAIIPVLMSSGLMLRALGISFRELSGKRRRI
jgi:hypothetical protein